MLIPQPVVSAFVPVAMNIYGMPMSSQSRVCILARAARDDQVRVVHRMEWWLSSDLLVSPRPLTNTLLTGVSERRQA